MTLLQSLYLSPQKRVLASAPQQVCIGEKEEEQKTGRRKPSLYTWVLILVLVLTSLIQQNPISHFRWFSLPNPKATKRQDCAETCAVTISRLSCDEENIPDAIRVSWLDVLFPSFSCGPSTSLPIYQGGGGGGQSKRSNETVNLNLLSVWYRSCLGLMQCSYRCSLNFHSSSCKGRSTAELEQIRIPRVFVRYWLKVHANRCRSRIRVVRNSRFTLHLLKHRCL